MIDGPEEARRFQGELVQQGRERMAKAQADWLTQIRAELDAAEGSPPSPQRKDFPIAPSDGARFRFCQYAPKR